MTPQRIASLSKRFWGLFLGALLALCLLFASQASAYEQVGNFAGNPGEMHIPVGQGGELSDWPEEVQLGGVAGMAVNSTGAGGVPAGTIYAISKVLNSGDRPTIARFNPDGSFSEAWQVRGEAGPYERCGPEGDPSNPHCFPKTSSGMAGVDVDIDQTTGNVYAFFREAPEGGSPIAIYKADGSEMIALFGEVGPFSDAEAGLHPEKIYTASAGSMAVDGTGTIYLSDQFDSHSRLMRFKPQSPGDYKHYVYGGQASDITSTHPVLHPVTDSNGDVYVSNGANELFKYDPSQSVEEPVCEFEVKKGGIVSHTVNSVTGEVFFYSFADRKIHRLSPCEDGEFTEVESFLFAPKRDNLTAMAVDPTREVSSGRAPGVLYAGARDYEGGETKGTFPNYEVESSMGYIFAPPAELAPVVSGETVTNVTSTSARLQALVNPKGNQTRYTFQYITDAAYQANEATERFAGATEAPAGGALIEGSAPLAVSASITGLAPDTTYHYRVFATNHCAPAEAEKLCPGLGVEKSFHTFAAQPPGLPDSRAFELVSPAQKHGGEVYPAEPSVSSCPLRECKPGDANRHFPLQSTPDGDGIVYGGTPFSFSEGAVIENQYLARRSPAGWQTANLTPGAMTSKGGGGYMAFDPALTRALLEQRNFTLSPSAPAEYANLYLQQTADPLALAPLLSQPPPNRTPGPGAEELKLTYAGASTDLSRIFFAANDELNGEGAGGSEKAANLYEWSGGQLHLVNLAPGDTEAIPGALFGAGTLLEKDPASVLGPNLSHAISDDGRRVFWSSKAGQLYVRIDGAQTQEVKDPGIFLSAAADGSKVLLNDGCLYDLQAEACEDLTQGKGGFLGIAGQSDDLSHIYFADTAALAPGAEANACERAPPGGPLREEEEAGKIPAGFGCNLYAWHEGTTSLIATVHFESKGDWANYAPRRTAEASPDGRWFAFRSLAPLTGYDNTGPCLPISGTVNFLPGPCQEVFLYDSASGDLSCASCNPSGASPLGDAILRRTPGASSNDLAQPRYLTDAGRLFFDSRDSLSPFDTNGGVEDVYEFKAQGAGGCERDGGCVTLISAGRSGVDSNLLAIDESGRNVFFTSRDQLVGADQDEQIDLYDAREGGGFPAQGAVGECQGESCQPPLSPPDHPTPATSVPAGEGNVEKAARKACPKGKVRKKGKCVKKHRAKNHHKPRRRAGHNHGGSK